MESIMELDDLKQAWQSLDRRLDQQHALQLHVYRQSKLDTLRRHLRPLLWGHVLQMLFGVLLILLAVSVWPRHLHEAHLLIAGLVVHVYGVAATIFGGIMLGRIARIDDSAPVLTLQKQLARVRRQYVIGGMWVGLPWWLLWVPCAMLVFMAMFGADFYRNAPAVVWSNLGVGVLGLLATWAFHRWSRHPSRPRLAKWLDDSLSGSSLRKAQAVLDEIARFERD
jgi:serine/threonine-protein kinase